MRVEETSYRDDESCISSHQYPSGEQAVDPVAEYEVVAARAEMLEISYAVVGDRRAL